MWLVPQLCVRSAGVFSGGRLEWVRREKQGSLPRHPLTAVAHDSSTGRVPPDVSTVIQPLPGGPGARLQEPAPPRAPQARAGAGFRLRPLLLWASSLCRHVCSAPRDIEAAVPETPELLSLTPFPIFEVSLF